MKKLLELCEEFRKEKYYDDFRFDEYEIEFIYTFCGWKFILSINPSCRDINFCKVNGLKSKMLSVDIDEVLALSKILEYITTNDYKKLYFEYLEELEKGE